MNATQHTRKTLGHLAVLLVIRGCVALVFAGIAVLWPEKTLMGSALLAGPVLTALAGYEIGIALLLEDVREWWLLLLDGLASVAFGMITFVTPVLSLDVVMVLAAVWLVLYGALSVTFVVAFRRYGQARFWFANWAVVNAAGAILLLGFAPVTTLAILWVGAFYAALFGFAQISAGVWLRKYLSPMMRDLRRELRLAPATARAGKRTR